MLEETGVRIAYEDTHILVVDKPAGLATVPLKEDPPEKPTLLGVVAFAYPETLTPFGRNSWEGGVLHRLDTPTSGLVIIVRTQYAFDALVTASRAELITKEYFLSSHLRTRPPEGFPPYPYEDPALAGGKEVAIGSLFRHWGEKRREVRPVLSESPRHLLEKTSGVWYMTRVVAQGSTVFRARITSGFRHQVRAHLAWSGHPIDGDERYGGKPDEKLHLRATAVEFPFDGRTIEVRVKE
ncbi:MAG: RNA pseudouridine synthase [Spirochaetales bacterium]|nr:RNA pseudouridine synthase [Spirochaetales bacterium]